MDHSIFADGDCPIFSDQPKASRQKSYHYLYHSIDTQYALVNSIFRNGKSAPCSSSHHRFDCYSYSEYQDVFENSSSCWLSTNPLLTLDLFCLLLEFDDSDFELILHYFF